MKKVAVVYWSGTGNTEAMAGAVAEGVKKGGAEVAMMSVDQASKDILDN
ncbi:MAG: flavodoxin domain-containing protein, partial [Negativicutes bacterium]